MDRFYLAKNSQAVQAGIHYKIVAFRAEQSRSWDILTWIRDEFALGPVPHRA